MNLAKLVCAGAVTTSCLCGTAAALVVPFTESFTNGNAGWTNFDSSAGLQAIPSGSFDGSAFARGTFNFSTATSGSFINFARANIANNASGSAFAGNWIAGGVTFVTFRVRHDAPTALSFFVRTAQPFGGPGIAAISFITAQPNTWSLISIPVVEGATNVFPEGVPYASVMSNVGNMQLGLTVPGSLANANVTVNLDIDNVSIVPAPGALALLGMGGLAALRRRR